MHNYKSVGRQLGNNGVMGQCRSGVILIYGHKNLKSVAGPVTWLNSKLWHDV